MKLIRICLFSTAAVFSVPNAAGVNIVLDYSHSESSFFDEGTPEGQLARAAVAEAASDVSAAVTTVLGGISTNVFSASDGVVTSATFTAYLDFESPDGGTIVELDTFSFAPNEFRVYVGAVNLFDGSLAEGGQTNVGLSVSGGGEVAKWVEVVGAAEAMANESLNRGDANLIINSVAGQVVLDDGSSSATADFDIGFASTAGYLWFDQEPDSGPGWHLDHTVAPTSPDTMDLYSVAVHEILHSLGFGIGDTWEKNVSGTNWTGSAVEAYLIAAEYPGGTNVVNGGHVVDDIFGRAIIDGEVTETLQESVMSISLAPGERRYLTDLDLVFLQDMGFATIPEPSVLGLALGGAAGLRRRRRA